MMTKNADKKREQMIMFCMNDMVPQNHLLRLVLCQEKVQIKCNQFSLF